MKNGRRRLLWVDGLGGLVVGVIVILLFGWLSELEGLPQKVLIFTGVANLVYGSFSTSLAARRVRPLKLIVFLAIANIAWSPVCLLLAIQFSESITSVGIVHLIGEGLYVGGLGCLEWRWREWLI